MKGRHIGEFEEIVMLACVILNDQAYGYAIAKEIFSKSGREVSLSAVHSALKRLESKGFLNSSLANGTTIRGGKPRRLFKLTTQGETVLGEYMNLRKKMWSSIPQDVYQTLAAHIKG